jgi:toxin YoeB
MPGAGNSRRITEDHRLVFLVDGDDVVIEQARYHYWCAAR